jgi:hypothetical protein
MSASCEALVAIPSASESGESELSNPEHCPLPRAKSVRAYKAALSHLQAWREHPVKLAASAAASAEAAATLKDLCLEPECATAPRLRPLVLNANVSEVRAASKFLAFLAAVGTNAKPGLIAASTPKTTAQKAETAELGKQAQESYVIAIAEAEAAEAAWQAAAETDKPSKRVALLKARAAANQVARAIGRAEPYPLTLP